ncbi:WXG100-like domain-containing protein, partial [Peterkaempfera griseoplana]
MAVMLPGELDEILDLIGIVWPNVDEDELRAIATEYRSFASELQEVRTYSDNATGYLRSVTTGKAVEAFGEHWDNKQSKGMEHLG